jgi:hypothetical protein
VQEARCESGSNAGRKGCARKPIFKTIRTIKADMLAKKSKMTAHALWRRIDVAHATRGFHITVCGEDAENIID